MSNKEGVKIEKKVEHKEMRRAEDDNMGRLYYDEELEEDGFEYRIVNDTPGRVKYLQRLGYELVQDFRGKVGSGSLQEPSSTDSLVEIEVGIHHGSRKAYLMRIRKEDKAIRDKKKIEKIERQTQQLSETGIPTQYGEVKLGST